MTLPTDPTPLGELLEDFGHPGPWPARYRVVFDRLGRTHNPPALEVDTRTTTDPEGKAPDELVDAIRQHAHRYCGSRDLEVALTIAGDEGGGPRGFVLAGAHTAGRFTVERLDLEVPCGCDGPGPEGQHREWCGDPHDPRDEPTDVDALREAAGESPRSAPTPGPFTPGGEFDQRTAAEVTR